jgi:hypothetical protein
MERGTPPQVKDEGVRTKIFDWRVPMTVGTGAVTALGTLEWVPESSSGSSSTGLIVALAVAGALALATLAFFLGRRRRPAAAGQPVTGPRRQEEKEAW